MNIRRPMCFVALGFLLFVTILIKALHFIPDSYDVLSRLNDGDSLDAVGVITDKIIKKDNSVIYLKNVKLTGEKSKCGLLVYLTDNNKDFVNSLPLGSLVKVRGKIYKFDAAENFGQFDSRKYYYIRGYNGRLIECSVLACSYSYGIKEYLWRMKNEIKGIYERYLNEKDAGVMSAVILGDKSTLDSEIKNLYQLSGITHILSLSGLHIATLGLAMLKLFTKLIRQIFASSRICNDMSRGGRKSLVISGLISSVIMYLYCVMTGMSVSSVRALIMYSLGLLAMLLGRSYDLLSSAAFSSVAVIMINPLYIYDAGFQLSFMAVVSIGIIHPVLLAFFEKYSEYKIVDGLLLSISVQLGTFPIVAYHYYQVSLGGIILNLIVVPLMSLVLILGVAIAVIGNVIEVVGALLGWIAHVIFWVYEKMSTLFTYKGWSVLITGKPMGIQIMIYYCVMLCIICYMDRHNRKKVRSIGVIKHANNIDQIGRLFIGQKKKFALFKKTLILCAFSMITYVIITIGHNKGYVIHNLSVGQGDCTVIRNKTHVIVIDCGSTTENMVGTYRLIPFLKANKISKVDAIFISHFDSDHVNGILELLDDDFYKYRIEHIFITTASGVYDSSSDMYKQLVNGLITLDIDTRIISSGDSYMIGDSIIGCISPDNNRIYDYGDTNNASMVLDIKDKVSGYRMLFTGDIGSETETLLSKNILGNALKPHFDYLKIAHHGSDSSSSCDFLNSFDFSDSVCVISVGKGNRYGHPGKEALDRIGKYFFRSSIFRTDIDNETHIMVR